MEEELMDLREEIDILNKRIEALEAKDNRRRAFGYTKILIRVLVILACAFGAWRGYEYLSKEVPRIMEEKIKELDVTKQITNHYQ